MNTISVIILTKNTNQLARRVLRLLFCQTFFFLLLYIFFLDNAGRGTLSYGIVINSYGRR